MLGSWILALVISLIPTTRILDGVLLWKELEILDSYLGKCVKIRIVLQLVLRV